MMYGRRATVKSLDATAREFPTDLGKEFEAAAPKRLLATLTEPRRKNSTREIYFRTRRVLFARNPARHTIPLMGKR